MVRKRRRKTARQFATGSGGCKSGSRKLEKVCESGKGELEKGSF
jgi:hypothetical protein